ncbi:MAG: hypothetical protein BGN82_00530 [Alphaproteobacteria bacterium 65-7]|nr:MAG: hypothetical protein BGN82_00530 [Alphaproteobacteria bacterium 65-7]
MTWDSDRLHRTGFTLLRLGCGALLIWAFLLGQSPLTFSGTGAVAVLTFLCILTVHELAVRDVAAEWIAAATCAVMVVGGIGYGLWRLSLPPALTGPLRPANEAMPPGAQGADPGPRGLTFLMGGNRLAQRGPGPFHILTAQSCPILFLERRGGGLMAQASFYDGNDDIAFRIRDNRYEPATPLALTAYRPDPHTLLLLDRFHQEVLYIRYLNPRLVRIRGRFLCGAQPQVIIRDDTVLLGGMRLRGVHLGQRRDRSRCCTGVVNAGQSLVLGGRAHAAP